MKIVDQKIFLGLASLHLAAMRDDPGLLVEFVDTLEPEVPKAEKWVLMVSTQFGCAVGCRMCDAGSLGYQGNLTAEEILDQVRYIFRANVNLDVKTHPKIKIHFARMGEPSLNPNVLIALRSLAKEFPYPGIVPSLSSVAPKTPATGSFFEELIDIKDEFFSQGRFQMQFSLHSTDERRRREIIPIKSWGLAEIASYGERFVKNGKRFSAGESPLPPDPRTSPDGSPRVLAGPLSTTGFKGDSPALN
ncbi:MAG: radical SAM protein, partial [Elusimicrobia bacterium]|nr:radical SAM protein [Elusimicrobiota bacterium]